jgi:alkylation response protein AidB-like acyl-CoA dehydrogenase
MDFELSEEHLMIKKAARDFAQNDCLPGVIERDEKMEFPSKQLMKLAELGFLGMMVSPEYGGSGLDTISYILAMEEISKVDASISVVMSVNNSLICYALEAYGTSEQKIKFLTPLAKGKLNNELYIGAFLLSEPESGSDATSPKTTAAIEGDFYILNGTKNWVTSGASASVYLVVAQTDVSKGSRGINIFIIEKNTSGIVVGRKENKLGIRASDTHTVLFNDVKVPKENKLGDDGSGLAIALKALTSGRIGIASQALGIAGGAYELSLQYAKEREAFGTKISNHQTIAFKLADMAVRIEAARLLCLKAASDKDRNQDCTLSSSIAKVFASETAMWATVEAVQIYGGNGYMKDYHVERLMRDAKITQIYEGTSEVQRMLISRIILN